MASANNECTSTLLGKNLEVKGVVDKPFNEAFTKMKMYSHFTSGLNFVTNFRRMFNHCTENRFLTTFDELYKNTLERGIKRRMHHVRNVYLARTDMCYNDFSSNRIKY